MFRKLLILGLLIIGIYQLTSYGLDSGKFDEFTDNNPDPGWVPFVEYYLLGQTYTLFGNWDKAIYRYERILKTYSETSYAPMAQFSMAKSYDNRGDKGGAIREYDKLMKEYPDSKFFEEARKRLVYLRGY